MGYINNGKINRDYFKLQKTIQSNNSLEFYTNQFNSNDYYIYKATNKFKEVSTKEFLDFKYGGYILFKKEIYDKNWLDIWIEWLENYRLKKAAQGFTYLNKPFPPFLPEKIKLY